MSDGGGGGADVSSMTTPSTIVIDDTEGSRLRSGGDDIKTSLAAQNVQNAWWRYTATRMPG
mgnify:CR=1 FL=1